jgi:hypothetical protein
MLRRRNFIVCLFALMVSSNSVLGQSSASSVDLSWMEAYVGKSVGGILNDSHFPIDVATYVPQVLVRLNGGLGLTPVAAAQFVMSRSLYVKNDKGFVAVSGCFAHNCSGAAGFILADTSVLHPSLTLAFAGRQKNRGTQAAAHQMNLYVYLPKSQSGKPLDINTIAALQDWLRSCSIGHIDQTFIANRDQFLSVPTPPALQTIEIESKI